MADVVLSLEKPNCRVTKNRDFGETGFIRCAYNPANRRIYEVGIGDKTVYGWDHTGIQVPAEPACMLPEFQERVGAAENPEPF